jgi:uridine kinase
MYLFKSDRDFIDLLAFPWLILYNLARNPATVAQQAEQPLRKRRVMGSIPFGGSSFRYYALMGVIFCFPLLTSLQYNSIMPNRATPLVIGIAGGSGSGKTTLANMILERVGPEKIAYLPHDAYYKDLSNLPPNERATINFDHPNSLDNELLIQHVQQLKRSEPVDLPIYDFKTHSRTVYTKRIEPRQVIMVEGILIFAEPALRKLLEVKIFVDTDADIRFIRRLERDINERGRSTESVVHQYLATVRPMHMEFVEPSKRYADVIIPEGGQNAVAMEMVVARLETLLSSGSNPDLKG